MKKLTAIDKLKDDLKEMEKDGLLENSSPSFLNKVFTKINKYVKIHYDKELRAKNRYFLENFRRNFKSKKKNIFDTHLGLATYKLSDLNNLFKKQYEAQINASLGLIRTHNDENMLKLKRRFYDWVTLKNTGDDKEKLRKMVELPKDKKTKFLLKDQTNKLAAGIDNIIANHYKPIAFQWKTRNDNKVVGKPGGVNPKVTDPKIHGDHWARKDKFYYYPNNEYVKKGYLNLNNFAGSINNIKDGMPGIPIGCRCYAKFIYALEDLPKNLIKLQK